jgi:purine-binding chemotaxis protein CheW
MPDVHTSVICRIGPRLVAVPVGQVVETMRPLPEVPLAAMPPFLRGVAVIRGTPTPVVDAGILLGAGERSAPLRFLTVKAGDRTVALAVDEVIGVRDLSSLALAELPPLLHEAATEVVAAVGTLDSELLLVLHGASWIPESVWQSLAAPGAES